MLASGAAYVPIDPELPRERHWQLIADTETRFVICAGGDWPANVESIAVPSAAGPKPEAAATKPTDLAYVIFTSGSTGQPKGVMIDHRGAVNTILDINRRFSIGKKDRVFAISSLSFDLSVYDIFEPLTVGGAIVMPDASETANTAHWPRLLAQQRVTVWNSVPALAQMLITELGDSAVPLPVRLIMMSGDWIPVSLPGAIRDCLPEANIVSLGGATEASVWSIYYPIETVSSDWASIPYGYPPPSLVAYVVPRLNSAGSDLATRYDLKAQQAGLRPEQSGERRITLAEAEPFGADWIARQSHRRFLPQPVPMEKLAGLIAALRPVSLPDAPLPKYGYPSAGSLYPVQSYLWIGDGRVAGLDGGWYYYHPARHDLVAIADDSVASLDAVARGNTDLVRGSAFSLFLVASMRAVTELYGEKARDFCMLEAGYMGQALMMHAPALALGLCPLGGIDGRALAQPLGLDENHLPLHALCGGAIDPAWNESWQAVTPTNGVSFTEKLRSYLAQRLPSHMVPRDIMVLEKLPLTANGKINR